tara:strand:- start:52 stop:423 length:372 start_codon:yes stop_codon:yes gene_type:complete
MKNQPTVDDALLALVEQGWTMDGETPTSEVEFLARFSIVTGLEEDGTEILSDDPDDFGVTWAQIGEKLTELEVEWEAGDYYRKRAEAYPPIEEQLDMQYWDAQDGTTTWEDAVAGVKAAHPKP